MTKFFRAMALSAAFVALIALGHGTARADAVTYNTNTSTFNNGTQTVSFVGGGGTTTITYDPTAGMVNTPGGANFGSFRVTSTVPSGQSAPISGTFTLRFTQTAPTAGTGNLVGTLAGNLGFDSGIGTITFASQSVSIGVFTYTLGNQTYTFALPTTGVGNNVGVGTTSIQGTITGSTVPEPATMVLLGTGLAGLAGAARRRMKKDVE